MQATTTDAASPLSARFRTREAQLFDRFYRALQAETGLMVPRRKAIDPRNAKAFLPYLVIQEVMDAETVITRLAGTVVVNRIGFNLTGGNVFARLTPQQRAEGWAMYNRILTTPCACVLLHREHFTNKNVSAEIASFPFSDNNGVPRYVVGVSVETDLQELALRGDGPGKLGEISDVEYIDIGGGT